MRKYQLLDLKQFALIWAFPIGGLILLAFMAGNQRILISPLSLMLIVGFTIIVLCVAVGTYAKITDSDLIIVKAFLFSTRIPLKNIRRLSRVSGLFGIWNL